MRGDYNHFRKLPKGARAGMRQRHWRWDPIEQRNYKRVGAHQHPDGQWSPETVYHEGDREWQKDVLDAIGEL